MRIHPTGIADPIQAKPSFSQLEILRRTQVAERAAQWLALPVILFAIGLYRNQFHPMQGAAIVLVALATGTVAAVRFYQTRAAARRLTVNGSASPSR